MGPATEELQWPVGPEISLGTILEVDEEVGDTFMEQSWASTCFVYDQFGWTPPVVVTTPSSVAPPLREATIADPPSVQTFATLVPLPPTVMGPPALSPEFGVSSSKPLNAD